MEKNTNSTGASATFQVDPKELQDACFNLMKQAAGTATPVLNTFAQLQQRRAQRLDMASQALRAKLGDKAPDVAAVAGMAKAAADLKTRLNLQTSRLGQWAKPRPNEWVVFGTVWDKNGNPAPGLTVRVLDRDHKYDDLLGETETDANGGFSVVYHERDFKETRENLPDLYVMVLDVNGKTLYSSRDSVRFEAGRSEYFAIRLGKKPAVSATKKRATRKG